MHIATLLIHNFVFAIHMPCLELKKKKITENKSFVFLQIKITHRSMHPNFSVKQLALVVQQTHFQSSSTDKVDWSNLFSVQGTKMR